MELAQLPPLDAMDLAAHAGHAGGVDLALPSMSMDSFLATLDDQDMALQQLRHGQGGDDLADSILPSWEDLLPQPGDGMLSGMPDWQACTFPRLFPMSITCMTSVHVVMAYHFPSVLPD